MATAWVMGLPAEGGQIFAVRGICVPRNQRQRAVYPLDGSHKWRRWLPGRCERDPTDATGLSRAIAGSGYGAVRIDAPADQLEGRRKVVGRGHGLRIRRVG